MGESSLIGLYKKIHCGDFNSSMGTMEFGGAPRTIEDPRTIEVPRVLSLVVRFMQW